MIRIDTCNHEPTVPESFACTDLLNTDRCAEFRDSALRVSANPAGYVARPPGSHQTATRWARIKQPMTKAPIPTQYFAAYKTNIAKEVIKKRLQNILKRIIHLFIKDYKKNYLFLYC